jgi:hypothetical protein
MIDQLQMNYGKYHLLGWRQERGPQRATRAILTQFGTDWHYCTQMAQRKAMTPRWRALVEGLDSTTPRWEDSPSLNSILPGHETDSADGGITAAYQATRFREAVQQRDGRTNECM